MCEHYVGLFGLQNFLEVIVPGRAYFGIAINLAANIGRARKIAQAF